MQHEHSGNLRFLPIMLGVIHDGTKPVIAGASMNYFRTTVNDCDSNVGLNRRTQISRVGYYDSLIHAALKAGKDYTDKFSLDHIIWRDYIARQMWCVFRCSKQTNDQHPNHWEFECLA